MLGPVMEETLRQTLFMTHGEWRLLFRPLSLALLLARALAVLGPPLAAAWRRRAAVSTTGAGAVSG